MRLIQSVMLAVSLAAFTTAADTPKAVEGIRLPLLEPTESPKPPPTAVTKLGAEQLYVVDSDVECQVLASPDGIVNISNDTGPIKIRGKFVENASGRVTTRTVKGPFVYVVEAAKTGRVELIIIPVKGKVLRRTLDVDDGVNPAPEPPQPPGPVVPPKPPEPKPDPVTSFRVILIYESADRLTPDQRAVMFGAVVENWLNTNCTGGKAGWRRRDKDAPGDADATMKALWDAVKPKVTVTPCVAVERNSKVEIINIEPTPAKMVEVFQTYKGK